MGRDWLIAPRLIAPTKTALQIPAFVAHADGNVEGELRGENSMANAHLRSGPQPQQHAEIHGMFESAERPILS